MSYSITAAGRSAAWLGAVLAAVLVHPAEAATVWFDPTPKTIYPGDPSSFSLDLKGAGFADVLDGGGVTFSFDPAVLQVTNVTVDGAVWDFFTANGTVDNLGGSVSDILFSALQDVTGNFDIATVQFLAVGTGSTSLALVESALNPFASGGNPLPVSFANGSVHVVPVPATLWLFASALSGLTYFTGTGRKS
jgi:hypothetical protein